MMDLLMVLTLVAGFGIVYALICWCQSQIDAQD